jgi:RNA polymerase sigma factor (sigma-70 family)
MRTDPTVIELVMRAADGDQAAWNRIVERYAPLVWAVCRRHRLSDADADDVGATVWLRLVERLGTLREPAALPGWIASTTRNECLGVLRSHRRQTPVDAMELPDEQAPSSDEWLLTQERHIALRAGFRELPERCQGLLSLLFGEPPTPYARIAATVGIPVGSIGPSRMRCLNLLRRSAALASLHDAEPVGSKGGRT